MFHEYFNINHIDGVYWTLTVELTFYFWIFILYSAKQLNRAELWFLIFIFLFIFDKLELLTLSKAIESLLILKYITFFVSGICLFKLQNRTYNKITIMVLFISIFSQAIDSTLLHFSIIICIYTIFYFSITGYFKFLKLKPFIFLGGISYSLYLIHQNIGYILIRELQFEGIPQGIIITITILFCIGLAYVLNITFEKPIMHAIRKTYKK